MTQLAMAITERSSSSEDAFAFSKSILSGSSSLYDHQLAATFNKQYRFFAEHYLSISKCHEYQKVVSHPTVQKRGRKAQHKIEPLCLRHNRLNAVFNPAVLSIREDAYFVDKRRQVALCFEIWRLALSSYFADGSETNVAFAVVWELLDDAELKEWMLGNWINEVPRVEKETARSYDLQSYVSMISKAEPMLYSRELLNRLHAMDSQNPPQLDSKFCFEAISSMRTLTPTNMDVFVAAVEQNLKSPGQLAEQLKLSKPTVRKSLKKLRSLNILRRRLAFSPAGLGLQSYLCVFRLPLTEETRFNQFAYNNTRNILVFQSVESVVFSNLLVPETAYASASFESWRTKAFATLEEPLPTKQQGHKNADSLEIPVLAAPILDFEDQSRRVSLQRPRLFDAGLKKWVLGSCIPHEIARNELNVALHPTQDQIPSLDHQARGIAAAMIKQQPTTISEFLNQLPGNRNRNHAIIKDLFDSEVIRYDMVMRYFEELMRIMVLFPTKRANVLDRFVEHVASRCPISSTTQTKRSIGISFLAIPLESIGSIISAIYRVCPTAIIAPFPVTLESSRKGMELAATKTGWKFKKPTNLKLVWAQRGVH